MNKQRRWRFGAVAGAVALLGSMACLSAHALSLGRITVQSALGEPLRAEIEISEMSAQEASSLRAGLGSPEAFRAAGLEFSPVLTGVDVSLQKRANGSSYLRLRGSRPVNEPFVDLLIQTNSATGSLSRDYAVLVDPPITRANPGSAAATAPVAPTAPQLSRPTPPTAAAPRSRETARAANPRVEQPSRPPAATASPATSGDRQLTVKAGDTAGRIAAQNKPDGVSLDQMLVAMQRGNPDAFIGGNINRIKSGALLNLPGSEAASAVPAGEASQTILAQSKDFNAFRRKLAEGVGSAQVAGADREAGGKVTAKVEDRAAAGATPDKLTLSKGAVQAKPGAPTEDAIAKKREAGDASSRVAELSKNINDLNKLGTGPGAVAGSAGAGAAAAAASAARVPGLAVPAPSTAISPAPVTPAPAASSAAPAPAPQLALPSPAVSSPAVAAPAAPAPAAPIASAADSAASATASATAGASVAALPDASAPAAVASEPAVVASAVVPPVAVTKPVAAPEPQARFIDDLLENPLVLPLAAGLLALLAGFGIYRYSRRNRSAAVDSSFLESRLQPDSFFGASGGQRIDTNENSVSGSSLVYSPSQLDAAGDVDPVAEADVYLAYGRDLQAEEILKEALRTSPTRIAIHSKLSEIYAKRRDSKSFESVANDALKLTQGEGTEWGYITEMGRELDPTNALYQPGGPPTGKAAAATAGVAASAALAATATAVTSQNAPAMQPVAAQSSAPAMDLDFDLDLTAEPAVAESRNTTPAPLVAMPPATARAAPAAAPVLPDLDMDFSRISGNAPLSENDVLPTGPSRFIDTYNMGTVPVVTAKGGSTTPAALNSGMLEFDLNSLSLDLNGPSTHSSNLMPMNGTTDDPLETKFSLAEEFRSLGDAEGARSLAEEVVAEARGPLKVKAQAFLNALA